MSRIDSEFLKKFNKSETPSGTINGSNVTFTLSLTPQENEAVHLFLDGLHLTLTTHYSISGTTITMVTAPVLGQELQAEYWQKTGE